jgi:2-dehydro-3-deoxyphosphooctonate aldolase (KDO 8-P synthase)
MKTVEVNGIRFGGGTPFVLIAGPCVIEEEERTRDIARFLRDLTGELDIPFIFKASYDKANRSARDSFRGPGLTEGLRILGAIRADFGCPVLSDVHRFEEIDAAAAVLDVVQIPAFLCRQTDFIMEIARKARVVNIKKGQFLAPWDVANVVEKVRAAGNERILVTERGPASGTTTWWRISAACR